MELVAETMMHYALLGNEIIAVQCGQEIGQCLWNMDKNKWKCWLCNKHVNVFKRQMPANVKFVSLASLNNNDKWEEIKKIVFRYKTIEDIKKIEYNGINIGYGCVSTYVSKTRNLNPDVDLPYVRVYIDDFLHRLCYQTYLHEKIINAEKPDQIFFINGRISNARSLVEIAKKKNLEYVCVEGAKSVGGRMCIDNFYNNMPHNLQYRTALMENYWGDISVSRKEKEWLGNLFFSNKQNGKYYGDKNYVEGQVNNLLPDNWNNGNKRYVIFNSSEDEFFAIGDEYDKEKIFDTQIQGIKFIAQTLINRTNVDLYLRIHPNLKNIKYRYHTDLLKLSDEYKNITVISGDSKISSYDLMRGADKIIVFGSTMGVESAYSKKVVINLAGALYKYLNVTYNPKTKEDLCNLLTNDNLKPIDNKEGLLKYGYYFQRKNFISPIFFPLHYKQIKLFNKTIYLYKYCRILGSRFLYALINYFIEKQKGDIIPTEEKK